MSLIPGKVDKICVRLQSLLDDWESGVPVISDASASTLLSQFHLFNKLMTEHTMSTDLALHDLPYLLIQTASQLWDREENMTKLMQLGLLGAFEAMYNHLSFNLLSTTTIPLTKNRFQEFISLLSTFVRIITFSILYLLTI